ncbi:MAG: DUF2269 family protein [Armatimonadetes bacterium]|nr:DUF2269 family protein [Anaerolineae bacterium]
MHPAPDGANPALYSILVYAHILLALMAVGFNFTYVVWIMRGTRSPETLPFALKGVKFLDDYLANPMYLAAGVTGVLMIAMGKEVKSWLWVAVGLYVVDMLAAYLIYTPLLSRQIKTLADNGFTSSQYKTVAQRSNIVGALLGVGALIIIALKIFEPSFW